MTPSDELRLATHLLRTSAVGIGAIGEPLAAWLDEVSARLDELDSQLADAPSALAEIVGTEFMRPLATARAIVGHHQKAQLARTGRHVREQAVNELRCVAVNICDGCLEYRPGQCHMPGCIFIRFSIDDIPDLRGQYEISLIGMTSSGSEDD